MADDNSEQTAGSVVSGISPALSAVPYVGPILSTVGSLVGGMLQKQGAEKQQQQAQKDRDTANALKPLPLEQGFQEKQRADIFASLSDMPGYHQGHSLLLEALANHAKAIRDSASSGGQALEAMSKAYGLHNDALLNLAAANETYKAGTAKESRDDLWNLGLQRHVNQQDLVAKQTPIFTAANNLDTAAFANKFGAEKTIINGLTSTATSLSKNVGGSGTPTDMMAQITAYMKTNGYGDAVSPRPAQYALNNTSTTATPTATDTSINPTFGVQDNMGAGNLFSGGAGGSVGGPDLSSFGLGGGG